MTPERTPLSSDSEPIMFAGELVQPVGEVAFTGDPEIEAVAANLVDLLNERRLETRIAEYGALYGYFEQAAAANEGSVPLETIRQIMIDALEAKK